jgi:hypothetical protein
MSYEIMKSTNTNALRVLDFREKNIAPHGGLQSHFL